MTDPHHHDRDNRPSTRRSNGLPGWLWILIVLAGACAVWFFFLRPPTAQAFVIERGQGLAHHVSYRESIDRAETCGLPVFMGRGTNATPITYAAARALESETDRIQVTVPLKVGDVFGPKMDDCPSRTMYR